MASDNKKDSSDPMGKLKNADVDKKSSSLILNYSSDDAEAKPSSPEKSEKKEQDPAKPKSKVKKKSKTKTLSKVNEIEEKNRNELKEQVETIKNIKNFLNMEVSTLVNIGIQLIKRINIKIFGSKIPEKEKVKEEEQEVQEEQPTEEIKPFSFKDLIDMNIIFTDNKRRPLYFATKKGSMYTQNDEILTVATMSKIVDVFRETGEKLKKVPVPDKGFYKDVPMNEIMKNITEDEIFQFLFYVRKFPSKYVGKNYRVSESFAAWVMSGTPDS